MIHNGPYLIQAAPIKDMVNGKMVGPGGTSFGLSEAGYDIRIKQDIKFFREHNDRRRIHIETFDELGRGLGEDFLWGRFALASAIEEFDMPSFLTGIVHDKSTWARKGLSVFNTVIEPGWRGFLTLELVYHGEEDLIIPAGAGIAQVIFHENKASACYNGKYQNQEDKPVAAIESVKPLEKGFHKWEWLNTVCTVCDERQFKTDSGPTCVNGHGGADGRELIE